jgi:sugar O-acyltransferase (sialic acid O-acetyltransferase NeuD family)
VKVVVVGAGGHAKALVEGLTARGARIVAYVDPQPAPWLEARHYTSEDEFEDREAVVVIGLGGTKPEELSRRCRIANAWRERGFATPAIIHPTAFVSKMARIDAAAQIMAGAIIQPSAAVGGMVIVNTGAIVEHDAHVGEGSHVAPGAVVLGAAKVGAFAMIGANAVVLPGTEVPDGALVRAASIWQGGAA